MLLAINYLSFSFLKNCESDTKSPELLSPEGCTDTDF